MNIVEYSEKEVLYFGIKIKERIKSLYKKKLEQTKTQDAKDLLEYLHGEQNLQIIWFKQIISTLSNSYPDEIYSDDYFYYLAAFISPLIEKKLTSFKQKHYTTLQEILEFILKIHDMFYEYFTQLDKQIIHTEKKILNQILQKEQEHKKNLLSLKVSSFTSSKI